VTLHHPYQLTPTSPPAPPSAAVLAWMLTTPPAPPVPLLLAPVAPAGVDAR
jgi:hypothetical protein